MSKYSLVRVDGNAFAIMGHTQKALEREGLKDLVPQMLKEAKSSDYSNLISVCCGYIEKANDAAVKNGYKETDYEEDGEEL